MPAAGVVDPLPAHLARVVVQLVSLLPPDEAAAFEIQRRLPDAAIVEGVWWRDSGLIRSYFGRADIDGVPIDIMGALQKRRSRSEDWTPPVDPADHRQYVELDRVAVPVMGLAHEAWAYDMLGRPERAALLRRAARQDLEG